VDPSGAARPAATDDRPARTEDEPLLLSVIIPTYNEAGNIVLMLDRLRTALAGQAYEIVVVDDDSIDETWRIAQLHGRSDQRIRVIRRVGERGLSSAVMAGMAQAGGRALVVMDADLQHDETKILHLVRAVVDEGMDLCVGSRHVAGGGYGTFGRRRRAASWAGGALARTLLGVAVSDPMSGFFAVSRRRFELVGDQVNPRGFKILLEFLARGPEPSVSEIGYQFGERVHGTTKLNGSVVLDYLRALLVLTAGRWRRR
ncbi:MAG: polyprenol monophosphomannose synthase, partial [Acidimicrobiales bacterium]